MNENYQHPEMPVGAEQGILKGLYLMTRSKKDNGKTPTVQLMGSGTILNECIAAAEILENDYKVAANIWSATSMNELARDGEACSRWNMLHPDKKPRISYVEQCLQEHNGPVIAATDYIKNYANQIRDFVPTRYITLGTDGYGRSDTRVNLRRHFEVDRNYIVVAALTGLAEDGAIDSKVVANAIKQLGIDSESADPVSK